MVLFVLKSCCCLSLKRLPDGQAVFSTPLCPCLIDGYFDDGYALESRVGIGTVQKLTARLYRVARDPTERCEHKHGS